MTAAPIHPLGATYRVQVHEQFDLRAVAALAPHIAGLGVSHIYLSPIFEARAGSTHGYDTTDPTRVRAGIGGAAGFADLVAAARRHGLRLLLDIVPNHMAASEENAWLRDVLEFGGGSPFHGHFDFSWRADPQDPRITLPVLGQPAEEAARAGELVVAFDELGYGVRYSGRRFPLRPRDYVAIFEAHATRARAGGREEADARRLAARGEPADESEERAWKSALLEQAAADGALRSALERAAVFFSEAGRDGPLLELLDRQHYRLVYWRDIDRLIGYRRFFDITELIGVRVEDERVFGDTHACLLEWLEQDVISGVRIDHVDGLLDPTGYLRLLRAACTARQPERPVPILVEKILAHDETLPPVWPVDGTTGYDFLNAVNGVFVEPTGLAAITDAYRRDTGMAGDFPDIVYDKKRFVLDHLFAGEWRVLTREVEELVGATDAAAATAALREITACLRVYRTYTRVGDAVMKEDRDRIVHAADDAIRRGTADAAAIERMAALLCLEGPVAEREPAATLAFVMRWQQLTGPVMAKGLEDTALYTFHPLASINDVGGEAHHGARSPAALHAFLAERAAHLPDTLNATSTHDTKRSEDVRARINALSEMPEAWLAHWARWRSLNERCRETPSAPTPNEEYLLYQSIVGAWPLDAMARGDFVGRMQRYMEKALREAKASTSWLEPRTAHERAVATFIERVLDPVGNPEFMREVTAFVAQIAPAGVMNALAQAALKAWAPGVPDFYQGTEGWAFDLVDPDNRRPVDYESRAAALRGVDSFLLEPNPARAAEWLAHWQDGRIKMLVTIAALRARANAPALFALGGYDPIRFNADDAGRLFGFARRHEGSWRILVVPCRNALAGSPALGSARLVLPADAPGAWRNALNGGRAVARNGELELGALLEGLPIGLLTPA